MHGGWGNWGGWSNCPVSCGGGSQSRSRLCNSPTPAHGGRDCNGSNSEQQQCNTHPCPRESNKISLTSKLSKHVFNEQSDCLCNVARLKLSRTSQNKLIWRFMFSILSVCNCFIKALKRVVGIFADLKNLALKKKEKKKYSDFVSFFKVTSLKRLMIVWKDIYGKT